MHIVINADRFDRINTPGVTLCLARNERRGLVATVHTPIQKEAFSANVDLDVYRGVDMSIVGIQAWRSVLEDSAPFEVPDFRKESARRQYGNDHWSPDPARKARSQPPSSVLGDIRPSTEARKLAKKVWATRGYPQS